MESIQMVAVFYGGPNTGDIPLDKRLENYQEVYLRVVSKAPFKVLEKEVSIGEELLILMDDNSGSGHRAERGIKFTFTPGSRVGDYEKWNIEINKLIWALMPELRRYKALVTESKAVIYKLL